MKETLIVIFGIILFVGLSMFDGPGKHNGSHKPIVRIIGLLMVLGAGILLVLLK